MDYYTLCSEQVLSTSKSAFYRNAIYNPKTAAALLIEMLKISAI